MTTARCSPTADGPTPAPIHCQQADTPTVRRTTDGAPNRGWDVLTAGEARPAGVRGKRGSAGASLPRLTGQLPTAGSLLLHVLLRDGLLRDRLLRGGLV